MQAVNRPSRSLHGSSRTVAARRAATINRGAG
nr:MAG TPA: hypothetical protein [Caudoviricetes sp.]